jgi:hypothetical protein
MQDLHGRVALGDGRGTRRPDEIANAVVDLVSDEGRDVTNQRITVSGGGF